MTTNKPTPAERIDIPPRQEPIRSAQEKSVAALRNQSASQLEWLGAVHAGNRWRLPVMDSAFLVELETGDIRSDAGAEVRPTWCVLALHYLAVQTRPEPQLPAVTFASLPSARTYATVYENRVNRRLCATAGRDATALHTAAIAAGAQQVGGGDLAYEMRIFPRISVRLIWYARDDELPPSCTMLLPANIELYLCTEDIVVMSESIVSRLSSKGF
jgi:hypothetical protein